MTWCLATLLVDPIMMSGQARMLMILPLALVIALVYKTTRCERLRDLPWAVAALWVTIVAGMYAVGVGLYLLFGIMV
jgi:hypothetical protein